MMEVQLSQDSPGGCGGGTCSTSDSDLCTNTNQEVGTQKYVTDSQISKARKCRDYNLRNSSIINRIMTEKRRNLPRQPKPKSKPPPLSKYRRKTANARERTRMQEINDAFETLRHCIPDYPTEPNNGVKTTKITTLRLALNYISALRRILGYTEESGAEASSSNSVSDSCSSPGGSIVGDRTLNSMDSSSEGRGSPGHSGLDSEGESMTL